jgi:hypothetical protein
MNRWSRSVSPFMPKIFNLSTKILPVPIFPSGAGGGEISLCFEGGVTKDMVTRTGAPS